MKVSTFWNKAFLAALHKASPAKAKKEADEAMRIAIRFYQENATDVVPTNTLRMDVSLKRHPVQLGHVTHQRKAD